MKRACFFETAIGRVGIAEEGGAVTNVFFGQTVAPHTFVRESGPLLEEAARQLREYLAGQRRTFELVLAPSGTPFQLAVWKQLMAVPYGQTCSYADIAARLGKPTASRAVGRANGLNPVSIFIPCHRVIGKDGSLTGYAGGLELKKHLLGLEGVLA